MKRANPEITHLFLDIGGVLLTNGWDLPSRKRAAKVFKLKFADIEERHHLVFEVCERGKITLAEYLNLVVFYQKRSFTRAQFQRFMFSQSQAYAEMIELISHLKNRYGLIIAAVSNETSELNSYRIQRFKLDHIIDFFISSCYVHVRKPDKEIFRLALDIAQVDSKKVLYIENTPMFVQLAEGLGIRGVLHTGYRSTLQKLASFGLQK